MNELINRQRLVITSRLQLDRPPRCVVVLGMSGCGKTSALELFSSLLGCPLAFGRLKPAMRHDIHWLTVLLDQLLVATAPTVVARINAIDQPVALILDDLDLLIDDQQLDAAIHEALVALLEQPHITLLLSSVVVPDWLPLARLALRGDCVFVEYAQLALTPDEIASLWLRERNTPISAAELQAIAANTGGWAVAVMLAVREGFPFATDTDQLLLDDVLNRMPQLTRAALEDVAWLTPLSDALVSEIVQHPYAGRLWREWTRTGIIIEGELHPLFVSPLRQRLPAHTPQQQAIQQRAASWYADHDDVESAVGLLRRFQAWTALITLLERAISRLSLPQYHQQVVTWLRDVPRELFTGDVGWLLARSYVGIHDYEQAILEINQLSTIVPAADRRRLQLLKANILQATGAILEADTVVQPYIDDKHLAADDQARVLRIHAIALSSKGSDEAALDCFARAYALIEHAPPSRLTGLMLGDYANSAARIGRFSLAERLLRLAQRVWHALSDPAPPDLATVLNLQAVVALQSHRFEEAEQRATQAYTHAMAFNDQRSACGALVTQGDVAVARQDWQTALLRYELAREQMQNTDSSLLPYTLAMVAQAARHSSRAVQEHTLRLVETTQASTPLDRVWLVCGRAALYLEFGIHGAADLLQTTLDHLGEQPTQAHGLLLVLLSEALWRNQEPAAAQTAWQQFDRLVVEGRSGLPVVVETIAAGLTDLVREAHEQWHSPLAGRLYHHEQPQSPLLAVRVLGDCAVLWQQQEVPIPKNGVQLITLLLLAGSSGLSTDALRERIWHDGGSDASWRKLIERVRHIIPNSISKIGSHYRLNLPFHLINADVLHVKQTPLASTSTNELRRIAQMAIKPLLPGFDAAWIEHERQTLALRGSEIWFTLATREQDETHNDLALEAYRIALTLNPINERAVIGGMGLALNQQQRSNALSLYEQYRRALYDRIGIDPDPTIESLYKRALDAD